MRRQHKLVEILKKYRLRSVYTQLIILVVTLTTALAVVSVAILFYLQNNMIEREREVQEANLQYAVEQLDLVMSNAYQAAYSIAGNYEVTRLLYEYNRKIDTYSESLEVEEVISKLFIVYHANPSIRNLFVVQGMQDYVVDQNGITNTAIYLKNYFGAEADAWRELLKEKHSLTLRLKEDGTSIYVLYSLHYKTETFATMCVELDMRSLQSQDMFREFVRDRMVCLVNPQGEIIGYLSEQKDDEAAYQAMQSPDNREYLVFWCDTATEKLSVAAFTPIRMVTGEITIMFAILLLSVVGFALLGCLMAVMIARRIYRPLYHAVELIAEAGKRDGDNELEVIRDNVSLIVEQNRSMSTLMERSGPIVLETMFRRLISKMDYDDELEEIWAILSPEVRAGYYMTVVVYTNLESKAVETAVRGCFSYDVVSLFRRYQREYVLVLYLNQETGRELVLKQCETLREDTSSLVAAGKLYPDVKYIGKSYQDAVSVLENRLATLPETQVFDAEHGYSRRKYEIPNHIEAELYNCITAGNGSMVTTILESSIQKNLDRGISFREYRLLIERYENYLARIYENTDESVRKTIEIYPAAESICRVEEMEEKVRLLHKNFLRVTEYFKDEIRTDVMKRILNYIEANLQRDIGVEDVANEVHLTANYLTKYFKAKMNMNFKEYLTLKRMEKAKELLKNPELKIKDVASLCGYNSSKQFLVNFTKIMGLTPTEYRRGE